MSAAGKASRDTAPSTRSPGATTSGLTRPSRVPPGDEKSEMSPFTADVSVRPIPFTSTQLVRYLVPGASSP